jgi:serine/threonine protein kinase
MLMSSSNRYPDREHNGVAYDQLDDSVQQASIETILSSARGWTDQQSTLDKGVIEHLSDEDLDAISLSEFFLTIAQFKLEFYHSSTLFENTSVFGLGTGGDFNVDVCTLPIGQRVAVKRVKLLTPLRRQDGSSVSDLSRRVRKVLQEVRILRHAPVRDCDSILNIVGASLEDVGGEFTTPSLVLEYAEFGTLRHYLSKSSSPCPMQEKQELCFQVGRALLTLHDCDICHGDVKLDNVLVVRGQDGKGSAKIADFGSSIIIQSGDLKKTYWGTTVYNAPEIRSGDDTQSGMAISTDLLFACDVFSFGLLLYESLHDGVPYWEAHQKRVPTMQTALDISNFRDCEGTKHDQPDSIHLACFRRAISLSLVPYPEERRRLRPILEAVSGSTGGLYVSTSSNSYKNHS